MSQPMMPNPRHDSLPRGTDPLALLEVGLRPATAAQGGTVEALSVEDVAAMLPAYEIERKIGQGGMGAVFAAVQRDLQRRVAVKLLSPALAETPGLSVRFRHESRLMASLQHPGVVQVYEAGETAEGHLYYVMEFVDGEDLATRLQRGRLPVEDSVPLIAQVADALHAAHTLGIVHRDVKPANIFLSGTGPARLGDFGLALTAEQAAEALRLTRAGTTMGTVEYAAPEQLSRAHPVSAASDVFSLGVLAYEALTGELPRGNFDPPSLRNPEVDAAFDSVVLRALQTDPARRYADAGAFREAFLQAADRRRQQSLRDEAVRRKMLRRTRTVAALAIVSIVTGGSALLAWRARQEAEAKRAAAETAEQRMTGLFQFMLTDLRQRLEATGNLGAMESVLVKAEEHFRRHYEESGRSAESALELADVLVTRAGVIAVRGKQEEAEQLHTEALRLCAKARDSAPQSEVYSMRVFRALRERAAHRRIYNDFAGAMEDARSMEREAAELVRLHPGPESREAEVDTCIALAAVHEHGQKLDAARSDFLRAQGIVQELAAASPQEMKHAAKLAELDTALGSNAEARGDFQEMLERFTSYHGFVVRNFGRESGHYTHAAFRMGVALQKLGRPAGAIPYLKDATRLAERDCAMLPGHKGTLNHLLWCLHTLAQCHEAMGQTAEAAPLRQREAEVHARIGSTPAAGASTLESEFAQLASSASTGREQWWTFCQSLQRAGEALPEPAKARAFYEEWIARAKAAAPATDAAHFIHLVPAFLHNRLATLWLDENPARSGEHAQQALALREAVSAAHPDEPELYRDVLSSACHAATAAVRGADAAAAQAALQKIAACATALPVEALTLQDNGLFFAERSAVLLDSAASRWPDRAAAFRKTGSAISAALLDRLPKDAPQQETVNELRQRLTGNAAK